MLTPLSELIRKHGIRNAIIIREEEKKVWSHTRIDPSRLQRPNYYVGNGLLRPAYPTPIVFDFQLKAGFYWQDLIH